MYSIKHWYLFYYGGFHCPGKSSSIFAWARFEATVFSSADLLALREIGKIREIDKSPIKIMDMVIVTSSKEIPLFLVDFNIAGRLNFYDRSLVLRVF